MIVNAIEHPGESGRVPGAMVDVIHDGRLKKSVKGTIARGDLTNPAVLIHRQLAETNRTGERPRSTRFFIDGALLCVGAWTTILPQCAP